MHDLRKWSAWSLHLLTAYAFLLSSLQPLRKRDDGRCGRREGNNKNRKRKKETRENARKEIEGIMEKAITMMSTGMRMGTRKRKRKRWWKRLAIIKTSSWNFSRKIELSGELRVRLVSLYKFFTKSRKTIANFTSFCSITRENRDAYKRKEEEKARRVEMLSSQTPKEQVGDGKVGDRFVYRDATRTIYLLSLIFPRRDWSAPRKWALCTAANLFSFKLWRRICRWNSTNSPMPIVRRSGPAFLLISVMGDDGSLFPSDFCYFVVYPLALVTLFVAYRLIFQEFLWRS